MKPFLIFSMLLFCGLQAQSQSIVRYIVPNGNILTQSQLDSLVIAKNQKFKETDMVMKVDISSKITKGDTLFYNCKYNIANLEFLAEKEKREKFLETKLPDFEYKDIHGKTVNSAMLRGKPVVLNFWFTACPPCIAEMPELNRLKEKYKSSDIVFLSMTYETKAKVLSFLKKHKLDYQIMPDAKAYCDAFTKSYPINIFVDRNGIIKNIQDGMPYIADNKTNKIPDKVDATEFEKALLEIK